MRFVILIAAVAMQMCLGATYSWSVYVSPLKELTGLQQGPVQVPFTVFYFVFPLSMLIAGNYLHRLGTRTSAVSGGIFFGGGWLLASLGNENFLYTIVGIGGLAGIGAGMAYIVPLAVCIRWFPNHKGLVSGIAVAGFGGGAALVSQVGGWCMTSLGYTPFQTFFLFGAVFLVVVSLGGSAMKMPEPLRQKMPSGTLRIKDIITHKAFILLYGAMFCGLAAGFAINANLKEMYGGTGDLVRIGVTGVALFAIGNGFGRILWGMSFDRLGSRTIWANLLFQAVVLAAAPVLSGHSAGFLGLALLTGFNYGGVLVVYVSTASRLWGVERVGQVYGYLFSSNIPASVSPIIAGIIFDAFHSFHLVFYALSATLVCAACAVWLLEGKLLSAE